MAVFYVVASCSKVDYTVLQTAIFGSGLYLISGSDIGGFCSVKYNLPMQCAKKYGVTREHSWSK